MIRALVLVGLLFVVPAAAEPAPEVAIRQVLDAQAVAWNQGDLDAYMRGYWRSPQLSFFGGGTRVHGFDETLERYRKKYKAEGHAMGTLSFTELTIDVLAPDAAIARGNFWLVMPDGKKPHGLFTLVWRKLPEGWRIVHDHSSAD
jgi:ketosteroid isomerase-like protein